MTLELQKFVGAALQHLFGLDVAGESVAVQPTRKDFDGDYTVVLFPYLKKAGISPEELGKKLGEHIVRSSQAVSAYNVVKGFLNLSMSNEYWKGRLVNTRQADSWRQPIQHPDGKVLVEFSSPNTNKPLHLGHIRNILLGWSMSKIYEATGRTVKRVQIINDRGIAICKSMLAWQSFGNGETPESGGIKSDHFVGKWYVTFEQKVGEEYLEWQESEEAKSLLEKSSTEDATKFFRSFKNKYFNDYSDLGRQVHEMLRKWESGDAEVRALWAKLNDWVYAGFDVTYHRLGVHFDKLYYESETYLLGRKMVNEGLDSGEFFKKDDGSVWVDLGDEGMDQKILLRRDGTSVYLTQDLGTAELRYQDFGTDQMVYVVADEQNYHFQVLFACLKRLNKPYAAGLHHLSYGMVDLPSGRMKSREGQVVDADDLLDEVFSEALQAANERGEIAEIGSYEQKEIVRKISIAALKYFIIKVDPKRRMVFNPEESVDMQGQTGPYIQNAYVRIRSIQRKASDLTLTAGEYTFSTDEKHLLNLLYQYAGTVDQAAEQLSPAFIANYLYQLAKAFHRYYHDHRILTAETKAAKYWRMELIGTIADILEAGMDLLGIEMPQRM